jgi:hypothetical protein
MPLYVSASIYSKTKKYQKFPDYNTYHKTKHNINNSRLYMKNANTMLFDDFVKKYYDDLEYKNECGITRMNFDIPIPEYKCFYTRELKKKVFEYYKTDFENFGYNYDDI